MFKAESYVGSKLCRSGDLVVNTMWAWMAALGVARETGIVSPSYHVYRPTMRDVLDPDFVDYLLRTQPYASEYICRSTGIRSSRLRLYPEEFLDIPMLCPPLKEQVRIAVYLKANDQFIRRYIRNKRRLIELLNEQKQAIINQAVTRGLDPNVRLKSSGVDWLGYLPEHWVLAPLHARYSVQLGKMLDSKQITGRFSVPYLRNVDVQWDRINTEDLPSMDIEEYEYERYTLQSGDMLVCEGGDVGRSAFWKGDLSLCGFQKALHRVRVLDNRVDVSRFLYYVMYAASKRGVFLADGSENTIAHLTGEKLRRHRFGFAPRDEQEEIAKYLDTVVAEVDGAIGRAEREIDLAREYRTRLIADVVTGKLDVRGVETPVEVEDMEEHEPIEEGESERQPDADWIPEDANE